MNVFLSPSFRMVLYRDGRLGVVVIVVVVVGGDWDGIAVDTEGIGVGGVEQAEVSSCCSSSTGITKVAADARADRKAVSLGGIGDEEEDMERRCE